MLHDFTLCINTKFVFGTDAESRVGIELKAVGVNTVLIHHDGGSYIEDTGLLNRIRRSLTDANIQYIEFSGVQPNPRLSRVREGVRFAKKHQVDAIVAVGGGSVIDSAKAIGLGAVAQRDVWDFFTGVASIEKTLPVAAVLTNPASGSESSQVVVINNDEEHTKLLISDPILRPSFAFMNPQLTTSLPAFPTACGIVDIFSHICERYFTDDTSFGLIDRMAEGALRTLVEIGPLCIRDLSNIDYRSQIMWASTIAQNNTFGVGRNQDWSTHLLGNELSALYDTPHGATLSILMGSWMSFAYKHNPRRFARYAQEVFNLHDETMDVEDLARRGIIATESFFQSLNMPISFKEFNIPTSGVEIMLDNVEFFGADHAIGSVARLNRNDCREIYQHAFQTSQSTLCLDRQPKVSEGKECVNHSKKGNNHG